MLERKPRDTFAKPEDLNIKPEKGKSKKKSELELLREQNDLRDEQIREGEQLHKIREQELETVAQDKGFENFDAFLAVKEKVATEQAIEREALVNIAESLDHEKQQFSLHEAEVNEEFAKQEEAIKADREELATSRSELNRNIESLKKQEVELADEKLGNVSTIEEALDRLGEAKRLKKQATLIVSAFALTPEEAKRFVKLNRWQRFWALVTKGGHSINPE